MGRREGSEILQPSGAEICIQVGLLIIFGFVMYLAIAARAGGAL